MSFLNNQRPNFYNHHNGQIYVMQEYHLGEYENQEETEYREYISEERQKEFDELEHQGVGTLGCMKCMYSNYVRFTSKPLNVIVKAEGHIISDPWVTFNPDFIRRVTGSSGEDKNFMVFLTEPEIKQIISGQRDMPSLHIFKDENY